MTRTTHCVHTRHDYLETVAVCYCGVLPAIRRSPPVQHTAVCDMWQCRLIQPSPKICTAHRRKGSGKCQPKLASSRESALINRVSLHCVDSRLLVETQNTNLQHISFSIGVRYFVCHHARCVFNVNCAVETMYELVWACGALRLKRLVAATVSESTQAVN